MISPVTALYETLYPYLRDYGGVWGARVEPLALATAGMEKPCLLFFFVSGGRELSVPTRNSARLGLTVKCVADTLADALAGQAQISAALHNAGLQDVNPRLPSHAAWDVLTVTEQEAVWLEEVFEGTQRIYHVGYQYDFLLEKK